jgi:hypothetical protein
MVFVNVLHHYLIWHYFTAFREILHLWRNFTWFVVHYFSLPQLIGSWLAPWKRVVETQTNKWDLEQWAGVIIIGFLSRLIGFVIRSIIIAAGLLALTGLLVTGLLVLLTWYLLPAIIVGLWISGITTIINSLSL